LSLEEIRGTIVDVQIAPVLTELEGEDFWLLDPLLAERLQRIAEAVLTQEGRSGEVAVVLTDDESIQELNRDFLGEDMPTDVLSFSAQEDVGPFVAAPEAGGYLGDVIISYPRAVQQAREQGHSPEKELNLLLVHGILHLLGYDHAGEEDKVVMWTRQEAILANLEA
jgi:probable rRNA maturation factor